MKVAWFEGRMLTQQQVHKGLEYSFLSVDWRQLSPFQFCKEFLMDTIHGELNKKRTETYGFVYDPEYSPKLCLTETRILLRSKEDKNFVGHVNRCMSFLNQLETQLKFTLSTTTEVTNPPEVPNKEVAPPVMFVSGDPKWMLAPPLMSLYSLLLRVGLVYESGDAWAFLDKVMERKIESYVNNDDWRYLRIAIKTIKNLVETQAALFGVDMNANWPLTETVKAYDVHEYGGIVSLANGKAKRVKKEWYPEPVETKSDD